MSALARLVWENLFAKRYQTAVGGVEGDQSMLIAGSPVYGDLLRIRRAIEAAATAAQSQDATVKAFTELAQTLGSSSGVTPFEFVHSGLPTALVAALAQPQPAAALAEVFHSKLPMQRLVHITQLALTNRARFSTPRAHSLSAVDAAARLSASARMRLAGSNASTMVASAAIAMATHAMQLQLEYDTGIVQSQGPLPAESLAGIQVPLPHTLASCSPSPAHIDTRTHTHIRTHRS